MSARTSSAGDDARDEVRAPVSSNKRVLVVLAILFTVGVVLRLLGFFSLELWTDEARWAVRCASGDYGWLRPVGYMWLTKQLLAVYNSEQTVRALSYVAGIAQLPIVWLVLRRATTSPWAALVGVFLIAVNPVAVAMTKEFKPYALESCLHAVLVLLVLLYLAKPTVARVVVIGVMTMVLPLLAWSIVFVYPAVYAVIGLSALRAMRAAHERKGDVVAAVVGITGTFVVLGLLYAARVHDHDPAAAKWGHKYDVFYVGESALSQLSWYVEKTAELLAWPGRLDVVWPVWPATSIATQIVAAVLVVIGVASNVVRKRWVVLALFASPWLVALLFVVAKLWPYGIFRTNTFLLFYTCALASLGVDAVIAHVAKQSERFTRAAAAAAIALVVYALPWRIDHFAHKMSGTLTTEQSVRTAMYRLRSIEGDAPIEGKRVLLLDGHAWRGFRYYRDSHDGTRLELGPYFKRRFAIVRGNFGSESVWRATLEQHKGQPLWAMIVKPTHAAVMREVLGPLCTSIPVDEQFIGTLLWRCDVAAPQGTPVNDDAAGEDDDQGTLRRSR